MPRSDSRVRGVSVLSQSRPSGNSGAGVVPAYDTALVGSGSPGSSGASLVSDSGVVALPVPLKVLWENGREVLLLAPPAEVQELVIERIGNALADFQVEDHRIRMLKLGNVMSVTLHLRPADDFRVERIADLDRVRRKIEEALAPLELEIGLDVLFVEDMSLAR